MATIEQENELRIQLVELLEEFKDLDTKKLARSNLGDTFSFDVISLNFERIAKELRELHAYSLDGVPHNVLNQVVSPTNAFKAILVQIRDFDIESDPQDALPRRNNLIAQVQAFDEQIFLAARQLMAMLGQDRTDTVKFEAEVRETVNKVTSFAKTATGEVQKILSDLRDKSGQAGVAQHAAIFSSTEQDHEKSADNWMKVSVGVGAVTVLTAIGSMVFSIIFSDQLSETGLVIQLAISKIIIFSILVGGLTVALRNYRAHRHNVVVNRHRQNALNTFETFVNATDDSETKNAVLLRATETIFSQATSGYLGRETDHAGVPQVLEIFRSVGKKTPASGADS